jgi:hypothetical protein
MSDMKENIKDTQSFKNSVVNLFSFINKNVQQVCKPPNGRFLLQNISFPYISMDMKV